MGEYMNKQFEPGIFKLMNQKGYDLVPYVNAFNETPENGWPEFLESPRYSNGYASLWHSFAFVPETHMLKPYDQRVKATYKLMECFIEFTSKNSEDIKQLRDQTKLSVKQQPTFPIRWSPAKNKFSEIDYKGYEAVRKPSEISGLPRLYYDRTKPFDRKVKYNNVYQTETSITRPVAYIIPQGWWKVIELLKMNKVKMQSLKRDTVMEVQVYHIEDYKTLPRPFESHHVNSDVQISSAMKKIAFKKGDFYIPMDQVANRFLMEVLEPQATDSYFAWNYFDGILVQKEGFSSYAFEETAVEFLKTNPDVKNKLDQRKITDTAFSKSAVAQLNFIYQHSPYYEPAHMRYPVYRVMR